MLRFFLSILLHETIKTIDNLFIYIIRFPISLKNDKMGNYEE